MMLKRSFATLSSKEIQNYADYTFKNKVKSWVINSYGSTSELVQSSTRVPIITDPDDLLVKVNAASINPIDLLMLQGYGRTILNTARGGEIEFPLILGRDFSGVVIAKGLNVDHSIKPGDAVYGFRPLHRQGTFSEVITVNKSHLQKKPSHLTDVESTSMVYATMTAWSALFITGNVSRKSKVLILGASGGVGTLAVQLLKSQGCTVFATCSTDAVNLVNSLGADCIFDYKEPGFEAMVANEAKYDIILDCAKFSFDNVPQNWRFNSFITLNSPLLLNTDSLGLCGGLLKSSQTLISSNLSNCTSGKTLKWGFFVPSGSGFKFLHDLFASEKIKPVIHEEVKWDNLPDAFSLVSKGHLRGKVVINYN